MPVVATKLFFGIRKMQTYTDNWNISCRLWRKIFGIPGCSFTLFHQHQCTSLSTLPSSVLPNFQHDSFWLCSHTITYLSKNATNLCWNTFLYQWSLNGKGSPMWYPRKNTSVVTLNGSCINQLHIHSRLTLYWLSCS